MKRFLFKSFAPPTAEIEQEWMAWFDRVGDRFADSGNPMAAGV